MACKTFATWSLAARELGEQVNSVIGWIVEA